MIDIWYPQSNGNSMVPLLLYTKPPLSMVCFEPYEDFAWCPDSKCSSIHRIVYVFKEVNKRLVMKKRKKNQYYRKKFYKTVHFLNK